MSIARDSGAAFMEAYASVNAAQKQAVDTIEGPVMVVAGPGTGKTTMLTLRIAKILLETDVQPENILALTFTNSGVQAMRQKLLELIHDDAYRVGIFTFHSFAEYIIKQYPSHFRSLEFAQVAEELERVRIIETIIEAGSYQEVVSAYDKFASVNQIKNAIDNLKKEGLSPADVEARIPDWKEELLADDSVYYKRKFGEHEAGDIKPAEAEKIDKKVSKAMEIADIFTQYQVKLEAANRYDFSDMVLRVLEVLETNENLKLDLQEQYQYLLVDEHQDTNEGQNRLIELLTDAAHLDGRPNLFTVGDEKQSIYRFQGASAETFTHFESHFTDVKVIPLTENYRSTRSILAGAHTLISHSLADATALTTNTSTDVPITITAFSDYKFELLHLCDSIKAQIANGIDPREIAVIYRSNKHIADIKHLFALEGIPYSVLSKDSLLDDHAIANIITLLRVIHDPTDDFALGRALFINFLQLDPLASTTLLREHRAMNRTEPQSLLTRLEADDRYQSLVTLLRQLKTIAENEPFTTFIKELLEQSGYMEWMLASPDSQAHLRKLDALMNEIKRQADATKGYALADFIAFVDAHHKYKLDIEVTMAGRERGVQCLTAHKSKGLEFAHVYIIHAVRSNWEKSRGMPSLALPIDVYRGDVNDERRLFYVAMTRAKETLTISYAEKDWQGKVLEPSQFVSELDDSIVTRPDMSTYEDEVLSRLIAFHKTVSVSESIFAPDYLAELFRSQNFSVTALNNYLQCANVYLFRNLIQLPDVYSPTLAFGNVMHEALESFFKQAAEQEQIGTKAELLTYFESALDRSSLWGVEYKDFKIRGKRALSMYFDTYYETWTPRVRTELHVKKQLLLSTEETITLSGLLDKIEFLDSPEAGKVQIVDYKTGKPYSEKTTKAQKQDLERQIVFYYLLLSTYRDGAYQINKATLDFVEPSKKGTLEQKSFAVTEGDIADLTELIVKVANEILDGSFLTKGCQKKDCEWCQLRLRLEA